MERNHEEFSPSAALAELEFQELLLRRAYADLASLREETKSIEKSRHKTAGLKETTERERLNVAGIQVGEGSWPCT